MTVTPADQNSQLSQIALAAVLADTGSTLLHQTADRRFDRVEGPVATWFDGELVGKTETALPGPVSECFAQNFQRCSDSGETVQFGFEIARDAGRVFLEASMRPAPNGVLTIVTNVTEKYVAQQSLSSLMREVSHRSKNLLAIVQSVAMQTAVHSGGVQEFLDKFRGRLHALSGTQDLVTESNWRGTHLQSLIAAQLTRVKKPTLANFRVTGENPILGPNASLHIGLAIHELAVNAVRHGAFSRDKPGQVWIDASFLREEARPDQLVIEWRESGVTTSGQPAAPRFGTLVLERIVPLSVGGTADYQISGNTVSYRLVVPAGQYEG